MLGVMAMVMAFGIGANAQNSLPAPGSGGSFQPAGGYGGGYGAGFNDGLNAGLNWNPGPPPPAVWGNPWYGGWNYSPTIVVNPTESPLSDQGTTKVIACGYDAQGVWRVLPLLVSYQYTGAQYSVNVLNAWNPWTDSWEKGVDVPAYNTDHWLKNVEYDFYVVLSTGTFYFNL